MKEIYMQPSTKAIKITAAQMVMTSVPVDPSTETSTQLSKGSSFDLFEEEEVATRSDSDDFWEDWEDEEEY